jgi:hypothetical protein
VEDDTARRHPHAPGVETLEPGLHTALVQYNTEQENFLRSSVTTMNTNLGQDLCVSAEPEDEYSPWSN